VKSFRADFLGSTFYGMKRQEDASIAMPEISKPFLKSAFFFGISLVSDRETNLTNPKKSSAAPM
jgi:hypothetical protein